MMRMNNNEWPLCDLEHLICCPICHSKEFNVIYKNLADRVFYSAPGLWSICSCSSCGVYFLNSRPSEQSISRAYSKYYTHSVPNRLSCDDISFVRKFVRSLANSYRNKRFGSILQPELHYGWVIILCVPMLSHLLDVELRYLPRIQKNSLLLDVGFGSGDFLHLARGLGWTVFGTDIDDIAVKSALNRGLDVRCGAIDAYCVEGYKFDVITMNHVIEHVYNPIRDLSIAYELLNPGGCLIIETPNIDSIGHKEFARNWMDLDPPRHLILHNWKSLEVILYKSGFRHIERKPSYFSYLGRASASRSISVGTDPFLASYVTMLDYFKTAMAAINIYRDYNCSEFVTILAYK